MTLEEFMKSLIKLQRRGVISLVIIFLISLPAGIGIYIFCFDIMEEPLLSLTSIFAGWICFTIFPLFFYLPKAIQLSRAFTGIDNQLMSGLIKAGLSISKWGILFPPIFFIGILLISFPAARWNSHTVIINSQSIRTSRRGEMDFTETRPWNGDDTSQNKNSGHNQ